MKIDLTGRHIEITPELREHVEAKLAKLDKMLDEPAEAHVVLFVEKHRHVAEVRLSSRSEVFTAQEETGDLYISVQECVDKLETQVRRLKDKRIDRRRHGVRVPDAAAALQALDEADEES